MTTQTYNKIKTIYKGTSVFKFISQIKNKGIPLSSINVNDWSSSPNTIVYVTIPYGSNKNSGKTKKWKNRFGETTIKSAMKFWSSRNK